MTGFVRPALLLCLLLFCLLPGCGRDQASSPSRQASSDSPPVARPPAELLQTQKAFSEVYADVMPAVVNISAARVRRGGEMGRLFEEFFGDFFQRRALPERREQSLGSGFIYSADGVILTNAHVVQGAEDIRVKLSDQRIYDAEIVGIDDQTDVAVLRIAAEDPLPTAVPGDSDRLRVGQWALAIGNPFGLDRTLTVGVISATQRANLGIEDYEDFIQTDASINPGNSGGPLLNVYGEVIGINTAIVAAGQGIGFAIPINLARKVADQLLADGKVSRGWLGVSVQPLTPELAKSFGLERVTGALVNGVLPDSPAEAAGLQQGDVLLAIDGKPIRGVSELQLLVAGIPAGQAVKLELLRDGSRRTVNVNIGKQAETHAASGRVATPAADILGLTLEPLAGGEGMRVAAVDPARRAAAAGVRARDVILAVNHVPADDQTSFDRGAEKARRSGSVLLLV